MSNIFYQITNVESWDDEAHLSPLGGSMGVHSDQGLEMFSVTFDVRVTVDGESKTFGIVFQNTERNGGMMAYAGWEMTPAQIYGCDADESRDLERFCDYDDTILLELQKIEEQRSKDFLTELLKEAEQA